MSTEYNGWTNYETWNVKLWIDNDYGSYSYWTVQAEDSLEHDPESAEHDLAQRLQDEIESGAQDMLESAGMSASMYADILGAGLSLVNWREIAESLLETAKEG